MARGLAEEILWYWHERERAVEMMREVRGAFEREINRGTDEGLDWSLGRMELARFETFRGRFKRAQVAFDLMHSNLGPYAMDWPFETPAAVSKYFRSARPHQRALAARRDQLASVGATGAIDRVAVAAISQARLDPLGVIALATRSTDRLTLKLGWTELSLRWRMGTIEGTLDLAPGIEWEFGRIRFAPDCAPAEDMLTHRKPIGMFLASPFVNGDLTVSGGAKDSKGCTTLLIKPELDFFNIIDGAATWVDVHVSEHGSLTVADDGDLQYDLELPSMVGREAKKKVRR